MATTEQLPALLARTEARMHRIGLLAAEAHDQGIDITEEVDELIECAAMLDLCAAAIRDEADGAPRPTLFGEPTVPTRRGSHMSATTTWRRHAVCA